MRILITGGAGYIGSHTAKYLHEQTSHRIIVMDNFHAGHCEAFNGDELIRCDVANVPMLDSALPFCDAVIHFAADIDVGESVREPSKYYSHNCGKMRVLLDACVRHNVKAVVFSSSAAVYGDPEHVPMDEEHPTRPINPYGWTKLIGEQMLKDYARAYGLRSVALRYFNAAGAAHDGSLGEAHPVEHHLIPLVLHAAHSLWPMKVFGDDYPTPDGSCIRDYVHVEDLAVAHARALQYACEHEGSLAVNLGSGKGYSVLELIHEAERLTQRRVPREIAPRRPGDPPSLVASAARAKDLLGWTAERSDLDRILADAWNWEQHRRF